MVSANRVAAINPPIDDTDPIRKFSIDSGSHMDWQNPAEFSPKGKPIRNFSIDPTSSIRTSIADAIFADAISETPINSCDFLGKVGVIRANRKFEWFRRIGLRRYKNRGFGCEWFARIDSRESGCESPMPLSSGWSWSKPAIIGLKAATFRLCLSSAIFNSVHTRCIVKTSGFTRGVCKSRGFY